MASSKTDLANLALGLLDEDPIMDIEQDEPKARVLSIHVNNSIDNVLSMHHWNAARKRAALTPSSDAPVFGWDYQYTLPSDCIRVFRVVETTDGREVGEWSVEAGRKILANIPNAGIIYVARIEQIPHLPPYLAEAIAYHLALRVARAITGNDTKAPRLREEFERVVLPEARHRDAQEGAGNENHPMRRILWRTGNLRARFKGSAGELDNKNLEDIPESPIP